MALNGKNVVFVGGLGAIGFEASKALVTKNIANLVILDAIENPKSVEELRTINRNVSYIKLDITSKDSIKKAIIETVAKVKYIDVLINGAGIMADRNVELTININLIGLINTTLEALPYLDKRKQGRGGAIVNIASVLGLQPCGPCVTYSASKFGVMGFSRSMADPYYYELTGVASIAFCPGLTETPLKNHIADRASFDYSQPIADKMMTVKSQTTAQCGGHLAQVCETFKNAAIFISDLGILREVEPEEYWIPQYT